MKKIVVALVLTVSVMMGVVGVASAEHGNIGGLSIRTMESGNIGGLRLLQ